MRHHLWEKVGYQHKVSAPSASFAITHQSSKGSAREGTEPGQASGTCGGNNCSLSASNNHLSYSSGDHPDSSTSSR